jgi:hypothetical protein
VRQEVVVFRFRLRNDADMLAWCHIEAEMLNRSEPCGGRHIDRDQRGVSPIAGASACLWTYESDTQEPVPIVAVQIRGSQIRACSSLGHE